MNSPKHPKVLIVSKVRVTQADNSGASIGKWFVRWPRDRVAQIYSGAPPKGEPLFLLEYGLTARDRRLGRFFYARKKRGLEAVRSPLPPGRPARGRLVSLLQPAARLLFLSGAWEIVFGPKLSPEMAAWIAEFKPDVLYVQPADLAFVELALLISKRFNIPIVVQMSDDFPERLYNYFPMSRYVDRQYTRLFRRAAARLATGPPMVAEYQRRYGVPFEHIMIADDPGRFAEATPRRLSPIGRMTVVYSGALGHFRWEALSDLSQALAILEAEGILADVHVFTATPMSELGSFAPSSRLAFHPAPLDKDIPSIFKSADVLFLPESFRERTLQAIRLSISTKSHLYMMAQRPILVYGPRGAGVVDYAVTEDWAFTVTSRSIVALAKGLKEAFMDPTNSIHQSSAQRVVEQNHRIDSVASRFERILELAAANSTH